MSLFFSFACGCARIFENARAYNRTMKKLYGILATVVAVIFVTAVALCVQVLSLPQSVSAFSQSGMTVVVDAGHGGVDGGVTGIATGAKESDINLAIARLLKVELEELGFEVELTRKTESGLYGTTAKGFKKRDMQKRKEIIQDIKPALVISLHQNFFSSRAYRGGQVFYGEENVGGKAFAAAVQQKLNALYKGENAKPRTEKTGDFFILKCCDSPSVLVECGFLSNALDEKLLVSDGWQKRLAQAIAAGTLAYFSQSAS